MKSKPETKIKVVPTPEKEEPVEVIAQAIQDMSRACQKLLNGRLKREAIVALIHDKSGIAKRTIEYVLNNLEQLEHTWLRKAEKK